MKHYHIPVFIPEEGCPFQCIYCNQRRITGKLHAPSLAQVDETIQQHLATIPQQDSQIEVAFFGGNFTGLPMTMQEDLLKVVVPFINAGKVHSVRLSTRPDYVDETKLGLLKKYHVSTIELGLQSIDEEVLRRSQRGHTAQSTRDAAAMIRAHGFRLGLQMMVGLPGDTKEKCIMTAHEIVELGAVEARIYPVIVIKDTLLEEMHQRGEYKSLSIEEAVDHCKAPVELFDQSGVTLLRVGLHPTDGLTDGTSYVAGPYHVSFRELVMTALWRDDLEPLLSLQTGEITIHVAPEALNNSIGYHASNRIMLEKHFKKVSFIADDSLSGRMFYTA